MGQGASAGGVQKGPFCHGPPSLEHRASRGEIHPHPPALPEEPQSLAQLVSLRPQWGPCALEVGGGRREDPTPCSWFSVFPYFLLMLLYDFIALQAAQSLFG